MANYWTRKDDESEELCTVKPVDEAQENGDKRFPDPHSGKKSKTASPWFDNNLKQD